MSLERMNKILDMRIEATLDPDGKLRDAMDAEDESADTPVTPTLVKGTPAYEYDKLFDCLFGLMFVFGVLRLFGAIDWSWLWILSPLWVSFGLRAVIAFIRLIFFKFRKGA